MNDVHEFEYTLHPLYKDRIMQFATQEKYVFQIRYDEDVVHLWNPHQLSQFPCLYFSLQIQIEFSVCVCVCACVSIELEFSVVL